MATFFAQRTISKKRNGQLSWHLQRKSITTKKLSTLFGLKKVYNTLSRSSTHNLNVTQLLKKQLNFGVYILLGTKAYSQINHLILRMNTSSQVHLFIRMKRLRKKVKTEKSRADFFSTSAMLYSSFLDKFLMEDSKHSSCKMMEIMECKCNCKPTVKIPWLRYLDQGLHA